MATEKFKALVHFIVQQCLDSPGKLGSIRLNKALWFADVIAYQTNGASITGEKYVKRARGPVPARIVATLQELVAESKIAIREPQYDYDTRKFLALAPPDTSLLSEGERALAIATVEAVCGYTANQISEMTHDIVWEAAEEGEEIPLYATLASGRGEITKAVRDWAAEVVAQKAL